MDIKDARHLALHLVNEACRNRGPNSPGMSLVRLWNIAKLNFFITTNRHFIQGSSRSEVEKLLSSHLSKTLKPRAVTTATASHQSAGSPVTGFFSDPSTPLQVMAEDSPRSTHTLKGSAPASPSTSASSSVTLGRSDPFFANPCTGQEAGRRAGARTLRHVAGSVHLYSSYRKSQTSPSPSPRYPWLHTNREFLTVEPFDADSPAASSDDEYEG